MAGAWTSVEEDGEQAGGAGSVPTEEERRGVPEDWLGDRAQRRQGIFNSRPGFRLGRNTQIFHNVLVL